jgi:hypothetical protein
MLSTKIRTHLLTLMPVFFLATILIAQFIWGDYYPADDVGDVKPAAALPTALQFRLPPIDQAYTELLDRPINLPNRRQPPLPGVQKNKPTPARNVKFTLIGIVLTEGNNIALIRETANGKVRSIKAGETINGLKLEKVEPDRIIFRKGATVQELKLTIETRK